MAIEPIPSISEFMSLSELLSWTWVMVAYRSVRDSKPAVSLNSPLQYGWWLTVAVFLLLPVQEVQQTGESHPDFSKCYCYSPLGDSLFESCNSRSFWILLNSINFLNLKSPLLPSGDTFPLGGESYISVDGKTFACMEEQGMT